MKKKKVIYRLYDDHEEKHYVSSTLDHNKLEKLVEKYKERKEKVYAKDFVSFLHKYDSGAEEVEVRDFYF
jgi:major membrane immunogen (membrane-anchored lipoprotein)